MLKLHDISFDYDQKKILDHFSLSVGKGELVALMGDSGIGKSTLLNLIAGLRKHQHGTIECHAQKMTYAFQEPRLFPWLTVLENVILVLPKDENANTKAMEALSFVSLEDSAELYPDELSGGMRSRASLARALAHEGDLYLLDEPFSALDDALRTRLAIDLRQHLKNRGASAILVTHLQSEAERFADRIIRL